MKLPEHVDIIREKISKAFNNQFSRLGFGAAKLLDIDKIPAELHAKRYKIEQLVKSHEGETGTYIEAREKALEELTFTLFNRLAAIKVMEALQLFPPVVTKQAEHGGRSLGHKVWLEQNPAMRNEELEGLREYFKYEFNKLGDDIPLFHKNYPYAFIPFVIEFNEIIDAINNIELDAQIDDNIWQSDDILGWLYESYNNAKKQAHKDSGDKTEYNKVSLQSQVYTPRWVVEFLVHNSLGKMYLEMYPDSAIGKMYKIANVPTTRVRELKPLHTLRLIDPASGSGNFLLYAFSFFYALYLDQIDNYDADYEIDDIPKLIIENNLYGIDLDDRAAQLAQLGLWIKAKQKNSATKALRFNVVSSDFYLPAFEEVLPIFQTGISNENQRKIVSEIWADLQQAYKFGSLVKIDEKLSVKLHGLVAQEGISLFGKQELEEYKRFTEDFFKNLETAVAQFAEKQGVSFLTDKTKDAITFLKLISQKYDVATANPPYTDSNDFGPELKIFIDANYAKPYKFNTNLYSSFIKRCFELTNESGKVAMVHPPTFMYIKTFEDVRKFILEKTHVDLFVEWGFLGMFNPKVRVDASMYILDKQNSQSNSTFIKLNDIYEGKRYLVFVESYDLLINGLSGNRNYSISQEKLKVIKSFPFVYWISDEFRNRFKNQTIEDIGAAKPGLQTGLNERFLRFWWEINKNEFSKTLGDKKKWVNYAKGGDYNKWAGNLWLKVNWENDGFEIINFTDENGKQKSRPQNKQYYFKEGITYSATGGKPSFRILPANSIFDVGGASIFVNSGQSPYYAIALLNSKVTHYILDCLNPTTNIQKGDIDRLLYFEDSLNKNLIEELSKFNVFQKQMLLKHSIIEDEIFNSPFEFDASKLIDKRVSNYLDFENLINSLILLSEAIIDEVIIKSFKFSELDHNSILEKQGISIGSLPVLEEAKLLFLETISDFNINIPHSLRQHISLLPKKEFDEITRNNIIEELNKLYQDNYNLESFCKQKERQNSLFENVNPINVWYWFKKSNVIPKQRMNDLALEFLAHLIKEILMDDNDGIIPLVPNAGEKTLLDRIEEKFIEKGFSMAQYSSFDSALGRELNDYINNYFFKQFTDHLNLFQYLPKTPFIWHLTSGPEQGFDCYLIIYKWNRDKLLSLRSVYIEHRERALINRQSDLASDTSAKAQNEKDKIYKQLKEIETFKAKIDELLAEGYNPILDDGVGKNIAPLQNKGMLAYEVLNAGQLKKYLKADW